MINKILFFNAKGKVSTNKLTSYFSKEVSLLSIYLYILLYNLKGIFGLSLLIFSNILRLCSC